HPSQCDVRIRIYKPYGCRCRSSTMKLNPLFAAAIVLTATPAFAAPQWVEVACWRYAQRVTPYLTWREQEAYRTNCIADWTAGTPPPQGRRSYYRNRYGIPSTQHPGYE